MGTFVLVFGVLYMAKPNIIIEGTSVENFGIGALEALPVGLLVWVIGLSLGGTTGYAINPARDLGPRIMHFLLPIPNKGTSDWRYSWIPILGPIAGGILGALSYKALFENEISTFLYVDLLFVIICLVIAFVKK